MKRASDVFHMTSDKQWEDLGGGIRRQILGWDNQIMMVKIAFDKGGVGPPHQHFHTQTTYCLQGKFEFTVDGEMKIIREGDALYIAPSLIHGAVCIEAGMLIDVFSPVREDFLDGTKSTYLGQK